MPDHELMTRLKDEFFLAARARPATAQHYVAWLEGYLEAGGRIDTLNQGSFRGASFVTITQDCALPKLESYYAVHVIAPPGVSVDTSNAGDCTAYLFDGSARAPSGKVAVWTEMLPGLLQNGYDLSRLVPQQQLATLARTAIMQTVKGETYESDYYRAFAREGGFEAVKAMQDRLRNADIAQLVRDKLELPPKTVIDAASLRTIEAEVGAATRALDVLHYKHDPKNDEPLPVFKRRAAKASATPPAPPPDAMTLSGKLEVGPPLRFKKRRTKTGPKTKREP